MVSKVFTVENLACVVLGYTLPTYISKTKAAYLSFLPNIGSSTVLSKPLYSFGVGFQLNTIVDLTGQFRKASTSADRFILLCTAFMAGQYAYAYLKNLSPAKKEATTDLPGSPPPLPKLFIILTKTVALAVQVIFHPYTTVAGVVTGIAISRIDVIKLIEAEENEYLKKLFSTHRPQLELMLKPYQQTVKTMIVWNEWKAIASSVSSDRGAFKEGLTQGISLASLFG